jgi:endonuclease/exonuclease/phosphatase family metal-dependent hydrolase
MSTTRIGSFNVENLFDRPKAMSHSDPSIGAPFLAAQARLNQLIQLPIYDDPVKAEMLEHLETLGLLNSDTAEFARLRKIRGKFIQRKQNGQRLIVANGRDQWVGWIELTTEHVDALAMEHTAMVIRDVDADVLGVVEADSRPVLRRFTEALLGKVGYTPFDQVLLLDGNDDRGIDVGMLLRRRHTLAHIRTHIYERDASGVIFSRDCAEYHVDTPDGERLVVLVNHLKSKGYASEGDPLGAKRRFRQAARIAKIYNDLIDDGFTNIAAVGDFNDDPSSDTLTTIFDRTGLRDISEHADFDNAGRDGTYGSGKTLDDKIDYVLLSPALFAKATGGATFRKGIWRGNRTRNPWPIYDTMTAEVHAASDHAAIYADIEW